MFIYFILKENKLEVNDDRVVHDLDGYVNGIKSKYNVIISTYLPTLEEYEEYNEYGIGYKIITSDGEEIAIKDYSKILENLDVIRDIGKDRITNQNISKYIEEAEFMVKMIDEDFLMYIKGKVLDMTIQEILSTKMDDNTSDMEDKLKELVEEVDKEDTEIRNELEYVNHLIKEQAPEVFEDMEIVSCIYNGIEMKQSEFLDELFSHKLPGYMTEKKIEDTLDDEYIIEMNNCSVVRKGSNISIYKK